MSASGLSQLCVGSVAPFKPKKINRRTAGTNKRTIHHEGRRRREEKPGRAERDKKGESSTDRGGRRMQLQRPRVQDHPKENTLAQ